MKINYMSDLHLEFGNLLHELEGDVLVLAGDIDVKARVYWINEAARYFKHVIYVLGNHEFYRGDIYETYHKIKEALADNVHLLREESITIEGITFHGTTLWSDFNKQDPMTMYEAEGSMNDYRVIRTSNYTKRFTPQEAYKEFMLGYSFLKENVNKGDVVITHMAPSFQSVDEKYKGQRLNGAYASDLSDFILDSKPALWFHGHMHSNSDYVIGDTRILCNPRGYYNHEENPDFNINATVEI